MAYYVQTHETSSSHLTLATQEKESRTEADAAAAGRRRRGTALSRTQRTWPSPTDLPETANKREGERPTQHRRRHTQSTGLGQQRHLSFSAGLCKPKGGRCPRASSNAARRCARNSRANQGRARRSLRPVGPCSGTVAASPDASRSRLVGRAVRSQTAERFGEKGGGV